MKKLLLGIVLAASTPAFARYHGPLIVKSSGTGFVMEDHARYETCEISVDKVVIRKRFGKDHELTETRQLATENLFTLIDRAFLEEATTNDLFICDAPTTQIKAVRILPTDGTEEVILYRTVGCGSEGIERKGPATAILREMIDAYCPTTH